MLDKNKINLEILGYVKSPYEEVEDIPIQWIFKPWKTAYIEIKEDFIECMKDLDCGFSHLMLFYYFDRVKEEKKIHKPFLEDKDYWCFSTRNNQRVNKLWFSIVKLEKIEGNKIFFSEVDILNNTPIIDIKPYVYHFDHRENVKSGWFDKHFLNWKTSDRIILNKKIKTWN